MNKELKQQAHREFDEKFPMFQFSINESVWGDRAERKSPWTDNAEVMKSFIDSIIDKTVQYERERIVEIVEENLELSCVDGRLLGKTDEYLIGYNTSTERWRQKRDNVVSLITNKSDINKDKE